MEKMRQYLTEYTEKIDKLIKSKKITDEDIQNHLIKIKFFQHERLIHLLVTLFYAVFILLSIFIVKFIPLFSIVIVIFITFLVFYVRHYFFLENSVQNLYYQYDKMLYLKKLK